MRVHYIPSEHWVDDAADAAIVEIAQSAESDVRRHLPALVDDLYLIVHQTEQVAAETGDGAFTLGPHCVRWDVDPERGVEHVAQSALRTTLFHELHHSVRLQQRPQDVDLVDWPSIAIFEGLASAFEDESGAQRQEWRSYDPALIRDWAEELLVRPVGDDWPDWKFDHPDGRRNVAYKVGTWLVDEAKIRSGQTPADLVWASPETVLELAGWANGHAGRAEETRGG